MIPFEFGDEPYDSSSSTMVSCGVTKGDTPISIVWMFNGSPISTNDGVLITKSGQKISMLSIESVQSRHAGNYTCMARNRAGEVSHSSELKVIGKLIVTFLMFSILSILAKSFQSFYPSNLETSHLTSTVRLRWLARLPRVMSQLS